MVPQGRDTEHRSTHSTARNRLRTQINSQHRKEETQNTDQPTSPQGRDTEHISTHSTARKRHRTQINPQHRKEETWDTDMTARTQLKYSNRLALPQKDDGKTRKEAKDHIIKWPVKDIDQALTHL